MSLLLNKAWRDLRVRPARSLLTILGIAVGVAGVVAVALAGRGLIRAQRRAYQHQSHADMTVYSWDIGPNVARFLETLPLVEAVERRAVTYAKWRGSGGRWLDIELQGLEDPDAVRVNQMEVLEGHMPRRGEIALEISARDLSPVELGQQVLLRGPRGEVRAFTVSGFTRTPYYPSASLMRLTIGYLPAGEVRSFLHTHGDNRLLIRLRDPDRREQALSPIKEALEQSHLQGSLEVHDPERATGYREFRSLLQMMAALSVMGLVISGFLVVNTMAATMAEEVREIGILKALGGTRPQVVGVYLGNGLVYALIGTFLGLAAGFAGGWGLLLYLSRWLNVGIGAFYLEPLSLGLGLLVGLGVTLAAALVPAWRGSAISVRRALFEYGIRAEVRRPFWQRFSLPPPAALALRNMIRRPARSLTTLLVVMVAVGAFLAGRATHASLRSSVSTLFDIYAADAWVWFDRPPPAPLAASLRTVPGVEQAEGWMILSCVVGGESVRLWGVPAESTLYRHDLVAGRWYDPGEYDSLVLSLDLAQRQGHRVGAVIEIEVWGRPRRMKVVGIVRDEAIFGLGDAPLGKVFAPLKTVQQLGGVGEWSNLYALGLARSDPAGVDQILDALERRFRRFMPAMEPMYAGRRDAEAGTRIITGLLYAMTVIVSAVGTVGITNTQVLNVVERRREVGVLRALGVLRPQLLRLFLLEGVTLGGLGFFLGVPLGWAVARGLTHLIGTTLISLRFTILPGDILLSLLLALLLSAVAGLLPALAAARLSVAEVLRYA